MITYRPFRALMFWTAFAAVLLAWLLFYSCTGSPSTPAVTWTGDITWEGWSYEDAAIDQAYEQTLECVAGYGYEAPASDPYVILVSGWISNGDGHGFEHRGCCDRLNNRIILRDDEQTLVWLRHEAVHWITGLGDEIHYTDVMQKCADEHLFKRGRG